VETEKVSTVFVLTISTESVFAGKKERHTMSRSLTTTELLPLVTPGEFLVEEYLQPLGITANRLAMDLHVPGTAWYW
jgi:hypothetical protein